MTTTNSIEEFPLELKREEFGHWLSGFTDGEGYFGLSTRKGASCRLSPMAVFVIHLRADDLPVLELIRAFFACGVIGSTKARDQCQNDGRRLVVWKIEDLKNIVVPHFDQYPLRAKKAKDFSIWRKGVKLLFEVHSRPMWQQGHSGFIRRWTDEDLEEFLSLREKLRTNRLPSNI